MTLPFSRSEFFSVFSRYNEALWAAPWVLFGVALFVIVTALCRTPFQSRLTSLGLALLWAWMGIVYHWVYFATINPTAFVFGALFVIQASLFLWLGTLRGRLRFHWPGAGRGASSVIILSYGLLVYPLLNEALGHHFPAVPTFGLPCPTTIFTLGILLWLWQPFPATVFIVPLVWAAIGGSAAFLLDVPPDLGLLAPAAVSTTQVMRRSDIRRSGAVNQTALDSSRGIPIILARK